MRAPKTSSFSFDHVFSPDITQTQVFEEVQPLVQSALDGYHVCLFAYGQTGSGKTHTMQGGTDPDTAGIIPRAVNAILAAAKKMQEQGWQYKLEGSFLEIHNEVSERGPPQVPCRAFRFTFVVCRRWQVIRDLLKPVGDPTPNSLSLANHKDGSVDVQGLTRVEVEDKDTVDTLLVKAAKSRSVACTKMNAASSRSHSVFTLRISGTNASKGVAVTGNLNLVDLAGSERLDRSKAEGDVRFGCRVCARRCGGVLTLLSFRSA